MADSDINGLPADGTPVITDEMVIQKSGGGASVKITLDQMADLGSSTALDNHLADLANPHVVTQTQVGLSNVDNTSDANKPVSTAQQTALDL